MADNAEGRKVIERKCCYDRSGKRPKRRDARSVARDVSETLAAMANADGGTLVSGIENDGTPSGVDYPQDRLGVILCLHVHARAFSPKIKRSVKYAWHLLSNIVKYIVRK